MAKLRLRGPKLNNSKVLVHSEFAQLPNGWTNKLMVSMRLPSAVLAELQAKSESEILDVDNFLDLEAELNEMLGSDGLALTGFQQDEAKDKPRGYTVLDIVHGGKEVCDMKDEIFNTEGSEDDSDTPKKEDDNEDLQKEDNDKESQKVENSIKNEEKGSLHFKSEDKLDETSDQIHTNEPTTKQETGGKLLKANEPVLQPGYKWIPVNIVPFLQQEVGGDGDEDLGFDKFTFSLQDPLTKTRITIPVKSQYCVHIECFDFDTFCLFNKILQGHKNILRKALLQKNVESLKENEKRKRKAETIKERIRETQDSRGPQNNQNSRNSQNCLDSRSNLHSRNPLNPDSRLQSGQSNPTLPSQVNESTVHRVSRQFSNQDNTAGLNPSIINGNRGYGYRGQFYPPTPLGSLPYIHGPNSRDNGVPNLYIDPQIFGKLQGYYHSPSSSIQLYQSQYQELQNHLQAQLQEYQHQNRLRNDKFPNFNPQMYTFLFSGQDTLRKYTGNPGVQIVNRMQAGSQPHTAIEVDEDTSTRKHAIRTDKRNQLPQYLCPICDKKFQPSELSISQVYNYFLKLTPKNSEKVEVLDLTQFKVAETATEEVDAEVIELSEDEEEEQITTSVKEEKVCKEEKRADSEDDVVRRRVVPTVDDFDDGLDEEMLHLGNPGESWDDPVVLD